MLSRRPLRDVFLLLAFTSACAVEGGEDVVLDESEVETAITAAADTWVRGGSSVNSNKGTLTVLSADRLDSGGAERRIYLKFVVPSGAVVDGARLEMYCARASARGGDLRGTSTGWTETGLTWNNQPALGGIVASRAAVSAGTWASWDVSSTVTGPGTYAFALTTTSDQEVQYDSRETSRAPRLVLTTSNAPPGGPDAGVGPAEPPPPPPPPAAGDYLLIKRADFMALSTSSSAWTRLKAHADATWPAPSLDDQDRKHGTYVVAAAMVYARTGNIAYRDKARNGVMAVIGTENASTTRTLAVGRQLGSYVLAADFIDLSGSDDSTFRSWLGAMRTRVFPAHSRWNTLKVTHEDSANNWGGWAGASLIAASLYLGDTADVAQRVRVVKGFLGDRTQWNDFRGQDEKFGSLTATDLSWSCNQTAATWVPLNPACTRNGINLDGAIPADASRGGPLTWPVPETGVMYTNEVLSGLFIQVELLRQAGYDLWTYQNRALERAGDFLGRTNGWNLGSVQTGNPWLANKRLGTSYPKQTPSHGRMLVGYDWLWGP